MNSKTLFREIRQAINTDDKPEEKDTMVFMLLESVAITKADVIAGREVILPQESRDVLQKAVARLNEYEPVQYILGESFFFGRTFQVDRNVLIPRPETEELVKCVIDLCRNKSHLKIIDLGTGSGCLAITLTLELREPEVHATDVSDGALRIAESNAKRLDAKVTFHHHDMLKDETPLNKFDVVVSNPPYIVPDEMAAIHRRVIGYEPLEALFTKTSDALQFYRAIAFLARQMMTQGGLIAVESNEKYGESVHDLFVSAGFVNVQLLQDLSGKDRIVVGTNP